MQPHCMILLACVFISLAPGTAHIQIPQELVSLSTCSSQPPASFPRLLNSILRSCLLPRLWVGYRLQALVQG
ncbi:uncharacterized protein GGS25DRAFT_470294, partial [Hypoxylon fragiforme]|uniref:uncharacterized protein n=1 Tax=Hypoxylon fragiforme TaxID=63214 RepID=UPI0020C5EBEC